MITPGSRYEMHERMFAQAHSYNEYGYPFLEGTAPNLKIKVLNRDTTYVPLPVRGAVGQSLEYYVKSDESPQWLGFKFLGDAKRWWQIAEANPGIWYPLDMKMGDYIGIPVEQ